MRRAGIGFAACLTVVLVAADGGPEAKTIKGWGTVYDRDGDCTFAAEGGRLAIAIPGTIHDLSVEIDGRMNAPRVLRRVDGDFLAEVRVEGDFPIVDFSLVPERRPFHSAGLLVWKDTGTYVRLERAAMVVGGKVVSYLNYELRQDGVFLRRGASNEHPLPLGGDVRLRLESRRGKLLASFSLDGVRWVETAAIDVELPSALDIGVAAVHNTPDPFEPRFRDYRLHRGGP